MNICLTIYYNYVYTQLPKRLQYEIKDDANQYEASMWNHLLQVVLQNWMLYNVFSDFMETLNCYLK